MDGEAKCNCQRCGQPIAFPVELNNSEAECPHCHKKTTLTVPAPETLIRAVHPFPWAQIKLAAALLALPAAIIGGFLIYQHRVDSLTKDLSGLPRVDINK